MALEELVEDAAVPHLRGVAEDHHAGDLIGQPLGELPHLVDFVLAAAVRNQPKARVAVRDEAHDKPAEVAERPRRVHDVETTSASAPCTRSPRVVSVQEAMSPRKPRCRRPVTLRPAGASWSAALREASGGVGGRDAPQWHLGARRCPPVPRAVRGRGGRAHRRGGRQPERAPRAPGARVPERDAAQDTRGNVVGAAALRPGADAGARQYPDRVQERGDARGASSRRPTVGVEGPTGQPAPTVLAERAVPSDGGRDGRSTARSVRPLLDPT